MTSLALQQAVQMAVSAQTPATGASGTGSPFGSMGFMLVAMLGVMFFIVWMPNRRREKERQQMLDSIQKGDKVVSAGGIFGTVVGSDQLKVVVRISEEPPVKVEFLKTSISRVLKDEETDKKKK